MIEVIVLPVTPLEQNCSLLRCAETGLGAVVDPGGEPERILDAARRADIRLQKIIVTHGHFDHTGAVATLANQEGLPIEGPHRDDDFLLDALPQWCRQFGFPPCPSFTPGRWLEEGDTVEVGAGRLLVRHCPGHTPGHVVLFDAESRFAIVGDVIFQGSIGRTDFPRGNHADLLQSIRDRIWPLGDDVELYPGHGPPTTVGEERLHNPFLSGAYG